MASKEAYITGVGQSEVGVRLTRHPLLLTIDAVKEALADAGLTVDQIDGVSTYPGKMAGGFSPVGSEELADALGIKSKWHTGGGELPAQLAAIGNAAMAVKQGLARHIICFRTVYEAAAQARPDEYPTPRGGDLPGSMQYLMPYWATSAANWVAQYANRHVFKYGMKREQLGQIAINAHRNAQLNPRARNISKKELTLDEYMEARMITTPLCLWDCDRYSDCSTVVIVSAQDALDEVKSTPIRIAAMSGSIDSFSWDQPEWTSSYDAGRDLGNYTD